MCIKNSLMMFFENILCALKFKKDARDEYVTEHVPTDKLQLIMIDDVGIQLFNRLCL